METVKIAEEHGGIAASGKIVEFPKELQRQFLETLIDVEDLSKHAGAMAESASVPGNHGGANPTEMAPPVPTEPSTPNGIPGGGLGSLGAPKPGLLGTLNQFQTLPPPEKQDPLSAGNVNSVLPSPPETATTAP